MHNLTRLWFVPALALLLACGDDGGTTDSSTPVDSGTPTDSSTPVDSGGSTDASGDSSTGPTCFPLSVPTADTPDAIPVSLTATSETWMRPTGEECPATGLGAEAVPFDTVCYVNDTAADITFLFEVAGISDPAPAAVIYDGAEVPTDRTQCAAVSSDLVIDVAEVSYTVSPGAMVTLVATFQDPGMGDVQFVITPE